jgi:hypothetical protein
MPSLESLRPQPAFLGLALLGALVMGAVLPEAFSTGSPNQHVRMAEALLHGRSWIEHRSLDVAMHEGRSYVVFPPFPALVLVPFVAVLGTERTNVVLIGLGLAAVTLLVANRLLERLGIEPDRRVWLLVAFFAGTVYWDCLRRSQLVYYFSHVVAVTCVMLALHELFGKGRGALVGLYWGFAVLSRQMSLYLGLFFLMALAEPESGRWRTRQMAGFAATGALCIGAYLAWNWWRFGDPLDMGYGHISPPGGLLGQRIERFGLFHPVYIPYNFVHLFLQGVHVEFREPLRLDGLAMDPAGTSLTFASPFVLAAFWCRRWQRPLLWSAWISIGLVVVHTLAYHNNGFPQSNGQRFTLDFLPLLFVLIALGSRELPGSLWKGAVLLAVGLNVLALYIVPMLSGAHLY